MRIAYVINSLEGGGTTAPLPHLFEAMKRHGADVKLFALAMKNGKGLSAVERSGVPYTVCVPARGHLPAARWLGRELDAWKPDILWTSLTRATLIGQRIAANRRLPVVSWQHNLFLKPANALLLRRQRRLSSLWIADSQVVADMARKRLKIDADRVVTWPIFRADPSRRARPRPNEPWTLGSLGRLHPAKGYDLLIEAMRRIEGRAFPDYRVCIGGTGDERDALAARAQRAGVAHRLALKDHVAPGPFLEDLDAYLQPSRREGFAIAAHEAMAAGLPVLAAQTGQIARSLSQSGGGALFPVGNVAALTRTLASLLESAAKWPAMGAANRAYALERYGPDAFDAAGNAVMERVKALL